MKVLLVLVLSVAAALGAPPVGPEREEFPPVGPESEEFPPPLYGYNYHEAVGYETAARIKASEEAADFDGARIVGGATVNSLGQYPFMAGLVIVTANGRQSSCGSSMVSNTRAVTAAHCWTDGRTPGRQLTVVLGSLRLFSGGTRVVTNQVVAHPQWNPRNLANDIAVIRFNHVPFTTAINRINLATGSNTFLNVWANAVGWGFTSQNSGVSQVLRHVSIPVTSNDICRRAHGATFVHASTLCANTAGGRGICFGDSGGPLHVASGNLLIGVSSFVHHTGCASGQPAGFMRVTSFATWIRQHM